MNEWTCMCRTWIVNIQLRHFRLKIVFSPPSPKLSFILRWKLDEIMCVHIMPRINFVYDVVNWIMSIVIHNRCSRSLRLPIVWVESDIWAVTNRKRHSQAWPQISAAVTDESIHSFFRRESRVFILFSPSGWKLIPYTLHGEEMKMLSARLKPGDLWQNPLNLIPRFRITSILFVLLLTFSAVDDDFLLDRNRRVLQFSGTFIRGHHFAEKIDVSKN